MRRLLLFLALPASLLRAQTAPVELAPRAPSLIILPGGQTPKPTVLLTLSHALVTPGTPKLLILPKPVILAPAPKIIAAARPLTAEEASPEGFPDQDALKALARSLDPSEKEAPKPVLDAAFDGALSPDAAAWDALSPDLARTPLSPGLPKIEAAARSLLARLLPRLYRRVETSSAYDRGENPSTGHTWTKEKGPRIELAPVAADSRGNVPTVFGFANQTFVSQKIEQLLGYAHEYAHVLFDSLTARAGNHPAHSVYAAMTEGFAVTVEQVLIERMRDRAPELGLTPRDTVDLAAIAGARRDWLAALDTHYSEGVLSWRKAYAQGGETGLLSYLASLSARRMVGLSRADPAYQLALGDPKLLADYLGGGPSPGLQAFSRAAQGETLTDAESGEAAAAAEQAGAEGWRRLFDRTLLPEKRIKEPRKAPASPNWWEKEAEPSVPVEPVFALARLSPGAAADLARYLAQTIEAPGGAARLFGRPGPNERLNALVAGAEALPWDDAGRRTWTEALTRWLIGTI